METIDKTRTRKQKFQRSIVAAVIGCVGALAGIAGSPEPAAAEAKIVCYISEDGIPKYFAMDTNQNCGEVFYRPTSSTRIYASSPVFSDCVAFTEWKNIKTDNICNGMNEVIFDYVDDHELYEESTLRAIANSGLS